MKTTRYAFVAFLFCTSSGGLAVFGTPQPANDVPLAFQGEITDSICAASGSHTDIESAKGIANSRDCVLECMKDGGKLVVRNPATGISYGLDTGGAIFNEDRLREFAGVKVKIIGSLDENTGLIWHIQSVVQL